MYISESELVSCYDQLIRIQDKDVWTLALQKFSSNGEWQCIIYLLLGPNLDLKPFKTCPTGKKNPFPRTTKYEADDFENIKVKNL